MRINWVDATKGIGIFLVCLGHCIQIMEMPLNKMILSFHMPLFFFLSGITANSISLSPLSIIELFRKKFYRLIIPMISFGIIGFFLHVFVEKYVLVRKDGIFFSEIIYYCNSWFLEALFFTVIITVLLISCKKKIIIIAFLFFSFLFFCFSNLPGRIQQIFVGTIFSISGYLFMQFCNQLKWEKSELFLGGELFLLPVLGILCNYNVPIGMADNIYGNKGLFFLNAYLGILIVCCMGKALEKSVIISTFLGNNSLQIYGSQSMGIYIIRTIMRVKFSIWSVDNFPTFFIVLLGLIVFEIPTVLFMRKVFPVLWGYNK